MALISDAYRALNAELHATNPNYGNGAGDRALLRTQALIDQYKTTDVLDYGCGKATLKDSFPFIRCYDPAFPEYSAMPEPADIVICRDVMEHVEQDCIDDVLDHIKSLTKRVAYFVIVFAPSNQYLPDGRNTHISIYPREWWMKKLRARWGVVSFSQQREKDGEFLCE